MSLTGVKLAVRFSAAGENFTERKVQYSPEIPVRKTKNTLAAHKG